MLAKALSEIGPQDIQSLVTNGVSEGRTLEFKAALPGPKDDDVKEFLADVTALANADGGDIVFGVLDEDGVAVSSPGVEPFGSREAVTLRLESLLRDAIEPRISPSPQLIWLDTEDDKALGYLLIRIPSSLGAPHRVTFKNWGKFFRRNSQGKAEMDTHELRMAFSSSEEIPEKLAKLHESTVLAVERGDLPFGLIEAPRVVLSVIPLSVLRVRRSLDLDINSAVIPPQWTSGDTLHSLEGFYVFDGAGPSWGFALTRRSGQSDASWIVGSAPGSQPKELYPFSIEKDLGVLVKNIQARMNIHRIDGPFALCLTLLNVLNHHPVAARSTFRPPRPVWRGKVTLPAHIVNDLDPAELMPIAESLWYSMGQKRPPANLGQYA